MGIRSEREHSSAWPYDPENPLTPRREEYLPPWRKNEAQFHGKAEQPGISDFPSRKQGPLPPSDFDIKRKLLDCLSYDSHVDENRIEVKVQDGDVTVSGTVRDHWMKLQVEGWAEQIHGVKNITNNITVDPFPEGH